ncbi:MAG: hypothetical protein PF489_14770, partial [Salinivirgaceae bacterium]|nr:hypothetical protein [Salinivirgaceae bacterium]
MNKSTFLLALLAIASQIFFTNCKKDENIAPSNAPEDITYPIDENSAFNMTNFIHSYEQIFSFLYPYKTSVSHDIEAGKAIYSYQNIDNFDNFGKKIFTFTHEYTNEGIITSSTRLANNPYLQSGNMTIDYDYDINGYITMMIQKTSRISTFGPHAETETDIDTVKFEYDENYRINRKTTINITTGAYKKENNIAPKAPLSEINSLYIYFRWLFKETNEETTATYEYNTDNQIIREERDFWKTEFLYSGSDLISTEVYGGGSLYGLVEFKYNNNKRYSSINFESRDLEYKNYYIYNGHSSLKSKMYIQDYFDREYTFTNHLKTSDITFFFYGTNTAITMEFDEEMMTVVKSYKEKDANQEYIVTAYNTIDSRNADEAYYKGSESAYD